MRSSEPAGVFYSILAFYLPLALLSAFGFSAAALLRFLLGELFSGAAADAVVSPAALLVPAVLSGLGASVYYSLMKADMADHTAAAIRGAVIVMILAYPLASLFRGGPLPLRFYPALANVLAPLAGLYAWAQTISLKHLFKDREVLEACTREFQGEKLRQKMLEDAALLSSLTELCRKNRRLILAQIFIVYALALLRGILGLPLAVPEFILLFLILLSGICFPGLLAFFQQEHAFAGEGLAADDRDRSKRVAGMGAFVLAAAAGAFLFARAKSILPISWLTGLLAWLAGLFTRKPPPVESMPPPPPMLGPEAPNMEGLQSLIDAAGSSEPWPIWDWIPYGFAALAALLFLRFMLRPLFDRSRAGGRLLEHLRRLAAGWLKNFRAALGYLFSSLRRDGSQTRLGRDESALRRFSEELFAAYSPQKQRALRGSVTLFARLILWGTETLRTSWKPVYGPGEYCELLKEALLKNRIPEEQTAQAVLRCGELFERALYAEEPLSAGEQREFKALVERIGA